MQHDLGDGVALRAYEPTDADEVYALVAASRDHLMPWHAFAADATPASTAVWIDDVRRAQAGDASLHMAIVREGRIVGNIGTQPIDWVNLAAEIGYWLSPAEQGRGTMTRAVRAFVEHAFTVWELGRVEILCAVQNARSRAVPERLGFTHEGTLRHAERIGARVHDLAVYGLLAEEWSPASGRPCAAAAAASARRQSGHRHPA